MTRKLISIGYPDFQRVMNTLIERQFNVKGKAKWTLSWEIGQQLVDKIIKGMLLRIGKETCGLPINESQIRSQTDLTLMVTWLALSSKYMTKNMGN